MDCASAVGVHFGGKILVKILKSYIPQKIHIVF